MTVAASSSAVPEPLKIRLVSGNYFDVLGAGAAAGRVLAREEDDRPGAHPVAVMSSALMVWAMNALTASARAWASFLLAASSPSTLA